MSCIDVLTHIRFKFLPPTFIDLCLVNNTSLFPFYSFFYSFSIPLPSSRRFYYYFLLLCSYPFLLYSFFFILFYFFFIFFNFYSSSSPFFSSSIFSLSFFFFSLVLEIKTLATAKSLAPSLYRPYILTALHTSPKPSATPSHTPTIAPTLSYTEVMRSLYEYQHIVYSVIVRAACRLEDCHDRPFVIFSNKQESTGLLSSNIIYGEQPY